MAQAVRRTGEIYDVVIVGGGIMGAAAAWFLSESTDFDGRIAVVERDPSYRYASTALSNSCMRQQFSTALNVRVSRFAADFVKSARERMGGDPDVPDVPFHSFGYLYLAATEAGAATLRANAEVQRACGATTRLLTAAEIAAEYPFYALDDIVLGSINTQDEGYFDGFSLFEAFRRQARQRGVAFIEGEVTGISRTGGRIHSVRLSDGRALQCGSLVNAAGPRAAAVAEMAGVRLPVEPRKRFSWMIRAAHPLDRPLPLTVDPSGIHAHDRGGGTYLVGAAPAVDRAVSADDFEMDHDIWMDRVWPSLAARIPQFDAVRVTSEWVGHYAMNTFDQNAIVGPHPEVGNLILMNGFSGHGLQQAPAMGRGVAEWLTLGRYRTLDLSDFHFERIALNRPIIERAII